MRSWRLLLGLAGLLLGGVADAQPCKPMVSGEHLLEAGKWQMAINPTLPLQRFVDSKGELQGLNVELAMPQPARMT